MRIDRRELGRHYASLGDEELLSLNRKDLTEAAQIIYDLEIASRGLNTSLSAGEEVEEIGAVSKGINELMDEEHPEPEWLDDGVSACSFVASSGSASVEKAALAQTALGRAGIPSHLVMTQETMEDEGVPARDVVNVMVPVALALHAAGILDRDLFNAEHETEWRTQLKTLSDKDLLALDPNLFCAGLQDRLARMKKVYKEEMTRRELKARTV